MMMMMMMVEVMIMVSVVLRIGMSSSLMMMMMMMMMINRWSVSSTSIYMLVHRMETQSSFVQVGMVTLM